jgi:MerR family regulatory protein
MLISEFARAAGLSRDTVRFYVRRGLLAPLAGNKGAPAFVKYDIYLSVINALDDVLVRRMIPIATPSQQLLRCCRPTIEL